MAADGTAIEMLVNIGTAMNEIVGVVAWPCYVAGCVCAISALTMMTKQHEGSFGKGIMLLFVAGIFAGFPSFIADVGNTLFDLNATGAMLSYTDTELKNSVSTINSADETVQMKKAAGFAISLILRVIGIIAVYKGCNRLKFYNMSPNGDPRLVSEAFTLITMGTITVFAKDFIQMIGNTVGGSFNKIIQDFLV